MKYQFEKKTQVGKTGYDYICSKMIDDINYVYAAKHMEKEETELDKQEMIAACDYKIKQYNLTK